jgi:hypothetical protein
MSSKNSAPHLVAALSSSDVHSESEVLVSAVRDNLSALEFLSLFHNPFKPSKRPGETISVDSALKKLPTEFQNAEIFLQK